MIKPNSEITLVANDIPIGDLDTLLGLSAKNGFKIDEPKKRVSVILSGKYETIVATLKNNWNTEEKKK